MQTLRSILSLFRNKLNKFSTTGAQNVLGSIYHDIKTNYHMTSGLRVK